MKLAFGVTWSMRCEGDNPMTGTGEFVYSGDTYSGIMKNDDWTRRPADQHDDEVLGETAGRLHEVGCT